MKIAEYMKHNEANLPKELVELLFEETSIWSNHSCRGYCIAAMQNAGFSREEIKRVMRGMHGAFDELTVEEAESVWRKW